MSDSILDNFNQLHYEKDQENIEPEEQEFYDLTSRCNLLTPNTEKAWAKIAPVVREERFFISKTWIGIAASLFIIGAIAVFYFSNLTQESVYDHTIASNDSPIEITLPDGSLITLNRDSELSYNKTFSSKRSVYLKGEAFFEVTKSPNPFIVYSSGTQTKVLGTNFNVKDGNNNVRVIVTEGKVQLSNDDADVLLLPGQEGIFNKESEKLFLNKKANINKIAWKTNVFSFNDIELSKAIELLSEHFNKSIEIKNESLEKCRISGTFQEQTLEEILEAFSSVLDLNVKYRKDIIVITGKGC